MESVISYNVFIFCFEAKPSRCTQKKRDKNESIRANLQQYGLEKFYVDALVADSSKSGMWRQQTAFDVIITDRKLLFELFFVLPYLMHRKLL